MESIKIFMQGQSLSIILISYQRIDLLEKSLKSLVSAIEIVKNNTCELLLSVYICINGTDDESYQLALNIKRSFGAISTNIIYNSKPVTPAAARNQLLQLVTSEFVFFMDDDVYLPNNIFLNFWHLKNQYPNIDVWGGPNLTPPSNSQKQKDCGWLVSQALIVGPIAQRYVFSSKDLSLGGQFNLMLCNLFVRNKVLKKGFEFFFKTAEENELIYRLQRQKCQMLASSQLFVWHERRKTYTEFIKQIFYYGYGRGQLLARVSLFKQKLFLLVPIVCLFCLFFLFAFPKTIFAMILLWLTCIQFLYFIQVRHLSVKILFLPLLMCVAYTIGLFRGQTEMITQYQKSKILRT